MPFEHAILTQTCSGGVPQTNPHPVREPLSAAVLLVPVWGSRFISQFLEFSLPTLLAPGNLPAVVQDLPLRVTVLSSEADEPLIRAHPSWRHLRQLCAGEIQLIDDLITESNHSATITLAFARAIRQCGDALIDTCFFLWMPDYLAAEGSLRSVIQRLQCGVSGVLAGNFQVIAEDAIPSLRLRKNERSASLILPARELVAWSFDYLHPTTIANIVNFGLIHNNHSNRLFWRVDDETLIGRFYLMHPIAIRPEITEFEIGSSVDYSFIPEMCPSGNIEVLNDSDDYFIVEMQPRNHQGEELLPGPITQEALAVSLSEWTTTLHRQNAAGTVVFHAGEAATNLRQVVLEADRYIDGIAKLLRQEPHSHRSHPYWAGSFAVNSLRTGRTLTKTDWRSLLNDVLPKDRVAKLLWRLRVRVFGTLPEVTRFHPRWPDYWLLLETLKTAITHRRQLLIVAREPIIFAHWLAHADGEVSTLEVQRLLDLGPEPHHQLIGRFDSCIVIANEDTLKRGSELIERIEALLAPGGEVAIIVMNDRRLLDAANFGQAFARHSTQLSRLSSWVTEVQYIASSRPRWALYRMMRWLKDAGDRHGWHSPLLLPGMALSAGPLGLISCATNWRTRARSALPPALCSSVFLVLRRSDPVIRTALRRVKPHPADVFALCGHRKESDTAADKSNSEDGLMAAAAAPSPKRILMVTEALARGGAERQMLILTQGLLERGYEVAVIELVGVAPGQPNFTDEFHALGIEPEQASGVLYSEEDLYAGAAVSRELHAYCEIILPDRVDAICSALAAVMSRFRPDIVYCWSDLASLLGGFTAAFKQVPRTVLGQRTFPPPFWFEPVISETYRQAYAALLAKPNMTMVNICSASAKSYEGWLGIGPKIKVVRNGFDPASVTIPEDDAVGEFRRSLGIPDGAPVVGGIMRFAPEKDPDLWLRASAAIAATRQDVHFILNGYGHGEIADELRQTGEDLGLGGRLHMPALVRDVGRIYGAITVFLLTSRNEATANVVIEAQAAGIPVVCPAVGGLNESVLDPLTGVLVRERSAPALADAVLRLLSDPARLRQAKTYGPRFVAQKFGLERMIDETVASCN